MKFDNLYFYCSPCISVSLYSQSGKWRLYGDRNVQAEQTRSIILVAIMSATFLFLKDIYIHLCELCFYTTGIDHLIQIFDFIVFLICLCYIMYYFVLFISSEGALSFLVVRNVCYKCFKLLLLFIPCSCTVHVKWICSISCVMCMM